MNKVIQPRICKKDKYDLAHLLMDARGFIAAVDATKEI
jgi:hypothetical protein